MALHPKDGERNRLCRPARAVGMNSSRFHVTTSSAKAFPVSQAGCGEVKNKQNTDVMGKSANALPWQREEMTKRRINHISRLTGCSRGKKCSFCLDLDSEDCDSAVACSRSLFASAPGEGTLGFDSLIVEFGRTRRKKMVPSHLMPMSPVNVNHWAAILEALLWCSWPHKAERPWAPAF